MKHVETHIGARSYYVVKVLLTCILRLYPRMYPRRRRSAPQKKTRRVLHDVYFLKKKITKRSPRKNRLLAYAKACNWGEPVPKTVRSGIEHRNCGTWTF